MDDFLLRALLAGLGVSLVAGPLGVFILWRRMAYFGDTLSHSAILGVAIGLLFSINITVGVLLSTVVVAALLLLSQRQKHVGSDAVLGILAHSALSLGLIMISFVEGVNVDINSLLFGDILSVNWNDLLFMAIGIVAVLILLASIWKPLLSLTVHEELARIEGVNIPLVSTVYIFLVAILVAVAMKVVGALLITSLLIIPAATARPLSKTPVQMAVISVVVGMVAVCVGLSISFIWDTPAGPSIVIASTSLFLLGKLALRR